jgi:hypothetical protein
MTLKCAFFWDVAQCWTFRRNTVYITPLLHIPRDGVLHRHCRENLKSLFPILCSTEHLTAGGGVGVTGGGSSYPGSARTSATASLASSRESSTSNPGPTGYRVVMLGSAGVGKSSLINQFMTSEYLHAYDTSLGKHWAPSWPLCCSSCTNHLAHHRHTLATLRRPSGTRDQFFFLCLKFYLDSCGFVIL